MSENTRTNAETTASQSGSHSSSTVSELRIAQPEEIQRIQLMYAERLRASEATRLEVEARLEKLEETHDEQIERYRLDIKDYVEQLLRAKDLTQQLGTSRAELEKNVVRLEGRCERLEAEREAGDSELARVRAELHESRAELKRAVVDLESVHQQHARAMAAREQELAALLQGHEEVEHERLALRQSLDALRLERVQESERHAQVVEQLAGARDRAERDHSEASESLARSEAELAQERQAVADLRRGNEMRLAELAELNARIERLSRSHADTVSQLSANAALLQDSVLHHRRAVVAAEAKAEALRRSTSFRLGRELIHAVRDWRAFLRLPVTLLRLKRSAPKRDVVPPPEVLEDRAEWRAELEACYGEKGLRDAEAFARDHAANASELAGALTQLARLVLGVDAPAAQRLARESVSLDPKPFRMKWLAFMLFDGGSINEAHELLAAIPADVQMKPSERFKALHVEGCRTLLATGIDIPLRSLAAIESVPGRILYIAASSQPYHVTGYTIRTHAVLRAIRDQGWEVLCVTRPGYPQDRPDTHIEAVEGSCIIDGMRYECLAGPHRRKVPLDDYLLQSAAIIEERARAERPALIHAASNYEVAIPALIAARRLGIPFIYEIRGFWEYTAASKIAGWEQSERFALDRKLETLAASEADQVLTLTRAMAEDLKGRGVPGERIALAPNGIDLAAFTPLEADSDLRRKYRLEGSEFVIGYLGSVVAYEGLDSLVEAFSALRRQVPSVRLLIVGDGDAMPALHDQVRAAGLDDAVVFVGRIPHAEVRRHYSLLDVVVLPRRPFRVCELVSPLKPLEAMAMGVPLVVSDVAALKEMVREEETALVHRAGDAVSLEATLLRLARDPELRRRLAKTALEDVAVNRTWRRVGAGIVREYARLLPTDQCAASRMSDDEPPPDDGGGGDAGPSGPASGLGGIDPVFLPPGRNSMTAEQKALLDERLAAAARCGVPQVRGLLARQCMDRSPRFTAFCELKAAHALLAVGAVDDALALARSALDKDDALSSLRSATRIAYNAAELDAAGELAERLAAAEGASEADLRFTGEVRGRSLLAQWACLPACARTLPVQPRRVLNILAFSLPYTSVGYAIRSHGLAVGIRNAGWDVRPYTRPGFPFDFKPELEGEMLPQEDEIDGIVYRRIFDTARRGASEVDYLLSSVEHWERVIEHEQPEVVHAASNYVTALPAMIAARRKGVRFVYEIRGFWEVTRSSRDEDFVHTSKYRFMELFEGLVARHADHVITITTAMKEELVARGVPAERIAIAFNSVDPDRFVPRPPDRELAAALGIPEDVPVIGYVGSFVDYEGLDDLVTACAGLKEAGHDFRLLLVGDGATWNDIREQVERLDLGDCTILTGRVPHDEVERYYSLIDIAPFPRKPWEVCELVSPLKPFEAMALEKVVVVSDTKALSEIVTDGHNGLTFSKGSPASLRQTLERLLIDADYRNAVGRDARVWIVRERSWDVAGQRCGCAYGGAVDARLATDSTGSPFDKVHCAPRHAVPGPG